MTTREDVEMMAEAWRGWLTTALPNYDIGEVIGQGAMGVVFAATHVELNRPAAVKRIQLAHTIEHADERFHREAQMLAALRHPHIVDVHDFVVYEGEGVLIMERCESSVAELVDPDGIGPRKVLGVSETVEITLAALAGLGYAHERGLLHRDIKPANLMYGFDGLVKLTDFGVAQQLDADTRYTRSGAIIGTAAYMSPEQCRGEELTVSSDLYSAAIMAYELMTGAAPFPETNNTAGLLYHHSFTPPTPLVQTRADVPLSIAAVIDRNLAKEPLERHATAEEFAKALTIAAVESFGTGWARGLTRQLQWPAIAETALAPDSAAVSSAAAPPQASPAVLVSPASSALAVESHDRSVDGRATLVGSVDFVEDEGAREPDEAKRGSRAAVAVGVAVLLAVIVGVVTFRSAEPQLSEVAAVPSLSDDAAPDAAATDEDEATNAESNAGSNAETDSGQTDAVEIRGPAGIYLGHTNRISSLAELDDGRIASGSWDSTVRIWNPSAPGSTDATYNGHRRVVTTVAVLPDGRIASSGTDVTVQVWSAAQPDVTDSRLNAPSGRVGVSAVLDDGRIAFAGTNQVFLWRPSASEETTTVQNHAGIVQAIHVLDDGFVVTGDATGNVRIWNPNEPLRAVANYLGHTGPVRAVTELADGRIASASGGEVHVWDRDRTDVAEVVYTAPDGSVTALAALADGRVASGGTDARVHVWNPETPDTTDVIYADHSDAVSALLVLGDGRIASGSNDDSVHVWDPDRVDG